MSLAQMNRDLTQKLVALLEHGPDFPPSSFVGSALRLMHEHGGGVLADCIDLVDLPHKLVDSYRFFVIATARSMRRKGNLTAASREALVAYEQALLHEQRACNLLMQQLAKDYGNGVVSKKW